MGLGIATPRRRGKEAPPQGIVSEESEETSSSEDADPNYLESLHLSWRD